MPRKWTEEDKQKIVDYYIKDKYSMRKIAEIFGCGYKIISSILTEKNVQKRRGKKGHILNKEEEQKIIDLYTKQRCSQESIAQKCNCCFTTVHKVLKKYNIETKVQPKKNKSQDEHFFDVIDTERKAYWLGFLFADGNVFRNQLSLSIHIKDMELLEEFKKDLKLDSKITIRHRPSSIMGQVSMSSHHICETLKQYGIVPNKTYVTKHLPEVPLNLLPHFLRGLVDGDGWVTIDQKGYYHIGFVSNFSSVCEDFKRYCNILTGDLCKAKVTTKGNDTAFAFQVQSKKATKKLATILYKDNNICLSRKYRLVEPLFDLKDDEDIV